MELWIPIAFLAFLSAVILVPIWLNNRTREAGMKLVHEAMARGQQLDPSLIEQILEAKTRRDSPRWRRSLGAGVWLLALAGGLLAAGHLDGDKDMSVAAAIFGCLAAGALVLAVIDLMTRKER